MQYILILIIGLFIVGCDNDNCETEELQCHKGKLEICTADHEWEEAMDCSKIVSFLENVPWVCCDEDPVTGEAGCVPEEECN